MLGNGFKSEIAKKKLEEKNVSLIVGVPAQTGPHVPSPKPKKQNIHFAGMTSLIHKQLSIEGYD